MNNNKSEMLYYPNFGPDALPSIKQSLLMYDRVNVIAPLTTPIIGSVLADIEGPELIEISKRGSLNESYDLGQAQNVVKLIPDLEIIGAHRHEFISALYGDLEDREVLDWERQIKTRYRGRDLSWLVVPSYFNYDPPVIDNPAYRIEEVRHDKFGSLLRVPFLVGMSLGTSEALWAAIDKGLTLFTDNNISEQFLMFRLRRGWKDLLQDPDLRQEFGIEQEFAQKFAAASLCTWTLRKKIPEVIKNASGMSIEEIIELREKSKYKEVLSKYRSGIADLVLSHDLWEVKTFQDFEEEAYKIYKKNILPAFEALEKKRNLSIKDVFAAFDYKYALKETIKSVPSLFISAAVPAAAGSALVFGSVAIAPAALLALGCGLGGNLVKNLLDKGSETRRSTRFLKFPQYLQETLAVKN